jgi:hypothetical protein
MLSTSKALFRNPTGGGPGPGPTDANFGYVPLLLNTTSTNGQQNNTFLDSSTNNFTITRNGTPTQGSITPYWPNGQWSNYFNGSSQLSIPNNAAFELGAGNFSYEAFVYATVATNTFAQGIISYGIAGSTGSSTCTMDISSTGFLQLPYATGTAPTITDPASFPLNQWVHCVACRSGSTLSLFVNGVRKATTTTSATVGTGGAMVIGGQWFANESARQLQNGYISNARVLKGASAYDATLSTLTVPTAPLTAISNTSLLTCRSNRFIDNGSANSGQPFPITVNGTPRVQAFQPFSPTASYTTALYGGSGYFNGSAQYIDFATASSAFNLTTGDWTFEAWVYRNVAGANHNILNVTNLLGNAFGANFYINTSNQLVYGNSSVDGLLGGSVPANQWTHVAVARSSGTATGYVNGISIGTSTLAPLASQYARIGAAGSNTFYFDGYISNVRLVKGTAVYTGNFTPPILAPLTTAGSTSAASYPSTTNVNTSFAASETSLLTNFSNAGIYDAAVQNNLITVGDAQASTTITAQWPPTSMKFDGTGDWLTAIDNPQLQLGTGDFTIEGWFYLTANGAAYGIVSKGAASTGWSVNVTSGNRIQFSYTAANLTGSTTTLAAATWYYFAVVRSGSATGNLKIYINGTLEVTSGGAVTDNFNQTNILYVGASRTGTTPLNGYLEDIRITKAARTITASPTAAFPTR